MRVISSSLTNQSPTFVGNIHCSLKRLSPMVHYLSFSLFLKVFTVGIDKHDVGLGPRHNRSSIAPACPPASACSELLSTDPISAKAVVSPLAFHARRIYPAVTGLARRSPEAVNAHRPPRPHRTGDARQPVAPGGPVAPG